MQRRIVSVDQDSPLRGIARLSCGHPSRTPAVPEDVGTSLDCECCDRREIPEGFAPHRRTDQFNQESVPKGLLSRHTTKQGVWGIIHVLSGRLEYRIEAPFDCVEILAAGERGTVLPEVEHQVTPLGPVEFYVEFWRREAGHG